MKDTRNSRFYLEQPQCNSRLYLEQLNPQLPNSRYNPDLDYSRYNLELHNPELHEDKIYYNRNLPHIQPPEGVFFLTFRLAGSLPKEIIEQMKFERKKGLKPDSYFHKFEELLDSANTGPTWLKDPHIAQLVADSLHLLDGKDYKLVCYSIMSNHVHVILYKTQRLLFNILHSIKRHTAREANILLNREGQFWNRESYDRVIRDRKEFNNKILYTLNNPVKAGLVEDWKDWKFNYCNPKFLPENFST